ncbi:uncharacterized protein [Dysidea avara]|uniref:uncharacterized protein isoform X2 n=1 Tax=Dysidea avara TaxID=196820 RepID=UPI00331E290B
MCVILLWPTILNFFLILRTSKAQGTITTQPSNVTVCSGGDVGFTCEVDRNGNGDIGTDDVMWQQLRSDSISNISGSYPFSITTTISGDILTSTLTISDVRDTHNGLYHCVVPGGDVMSRNASLYAVAGPPGAPMNIRFSDITNKSFVVQWDEVDDVDLYFVNWRDDSGSVREAATQRTSRTIKRLSPNTTYAVTVTAYNICGIGTVSDTLIVTTNVNISIGPSVSSSVIITATTATPTSMPVTTPTGSSSSSSGGPGVLVVIFSVSAVIVVVGIAVLILVIIILVMKKANCSKNTSPTCEKVDESTLTRNEFKNPIYSTTHKTSHGKHTITSIEKVLYETIRPPSPVTEGIKLQPNPVYGRSDKVVMDNNPAYDILK